MKSKIYYFLFMVFVVVFAACNKQQLLVTEGEFIEANLGNDFIRYDATNGNSFNNTYLNDTLMPFDTTVSSTPIITDQLNLIRQSEDGKKALEIYVSQSKLRRDSIPYSVPSGCTFCFVELQWRDYDADVTGAFGAGDDYNYSGGIDMVIESWDDDDFLEGVFSGEIRTATGKKLEVTNGRFRIQIFD